MSVHVVVCRFVSWFDELFRVFSAYVVSIPMTRVVVCCFVSFRGLSVHVVSWFFESFHAVMCQFKLWCVEVRRIMSWSNEMVHKMLCRGFSSLFAACHVKVCRFVCRIT